MKRNMERKVMPIRERGSNKNHEKKTARRVKRTNSVMKTDLNICGEKC